MRINPKVKESMNDTADYILESAFPFAPTHITFQTILKSVLFGMIVGLTVEAFGDLPMAIMADTVKNEVFNPSTTAKLQKFIETAESMNFNIPIMAGGAAALLALLCRSIFGITYTIVSVTMLILSIGTERPEPYTTRLRSNLAPRGSGAASGSPSSGAASGPPSHARTVNDLEKPFRAPEQNRAYEKQDREK